MPALYATADAGALTARVKQLLHAGRSAAARPLLTAARRMVTDTPNMCELAARVALQEGSLQEAQEELDKGIAAAPGHAGMYKYRAELRYRLGDVEGAARDAAEAVVLDRGDPGAKALLGTMMLELGRFADAVACLREAVAAMPGNVAAHETFAAALEANGEVDAALATLLDAIAAAPTRCEPRTAAVLLLMRRRDYSRAVSVVDAACDDGLADACLFGLKGHALSSLGRHDEASEAYREALKLGPEDPYVRHLVAASGVLPGALRAPPEYLRTIFNGYADRFDVHLVSLGYRGPGMFRAVLLTHPVVAAGERLGPVLDLGCGTGLVAVALSDLPVGPLVGVDIAPRMLAGAADKGLYAELHETDVMQALAESGPLSAAYKSWPLIMAADVLCYFGDLGPVLAAVHARLQPGGWFLLTTEELLPDHDGVVHGNGSWSLHRLGRYAHTVAYLQAVAEQVGFRVRRLERQTIRFEAEAPVVGILGVLERVRHDG